MADDDRSLSDSLVAPAEAPPSVPPPAADGDARPARDGGDDIASLLREYDESAAPKSGNGDARDGAAAPDKRSGDAQGANRLKEMLAPVAEAAAKVASIQPEGQKGLDPTELLKLQMQADTHGIVLNEFLRHHDATVRHQQATADFQEIVEYASERIEGANVSPHYVQRYLLSEANLNPALRDAWHHRRDSQEAHARFNNLVTSTVRKMEKEARAIPRYDQAATEDRELVTHAVRGASHKVPEGKPPDYSRMSPADFQAEKDRLFGG